MTRLTTSLAGNKWSSAVRSLNKRLDAGEDVPLSRGRDLLEKEREEQKRFESYKRAKDIWLRLEEKERRAIREAVIRKDPHYGDNPHGFMMESMCIDRIKEQLSAK